jgi:ATP-dependent Clp protease adapter protein ClpS
MVWRSALFLQRLDGESAGQGPSGNRPTPLSSSMTMTTPFEYVIATFRKVFGYALKRSVLLATEIHLKGRGIVWQGSLEVAELKRDQIRSAGPDFLATKKVDYPLAVELERLP